MDRETQDLQRRLHAGHRLVVEQLLDRRVLAKLAACEHEGLITHVVALAVAELRALRNPGFRALARGEGGRG